MKLHVIDAGNLKLDGGAMFGVVPRVMWDKLYPADENNLCNWSMRCLLVDYGKRVFLIDNGMGDKQSEKFFANYHPNGDGELIKSLKNAGYSSDDITDVLLTHLHFDHCGGGVKFNDDKTETELVFKNATYWVSTKQWNWATSPNRREKASFLKENILPMIPNLKLIDKETEIVPGFRTVMFDGHTDGQIIPHIQYKEKTIVYMGDLLPAVAHIPLPFVMSYDTRPLVTLDEKEAFLNEAADKGFVLFFEHDLYNECCTVKHTEKGVRVNETFKLSSIL